MVRTLVFSLLLGTCAASSAFGAAIYSVQVDEAGTSLENATVSGTVDGELMFDLLNPWTPPTSGAVYVYDDSGTNLLDTLYIGPGNTLTLIPSYLQLKVAAPKVRVAVYQEPGTNYAEYWVSSGSGQPGDVGSITARYTIVSDISSPSVPEPASWMLIGAGLLVLAKTTRARPARSARMPG